ncbi:hypothetical protein FKM82_023254 [Ascaphus truei]
MVIPDRAIDCFPGAQDNSFHCPLTVGGLCETPPSLSITHKHNSPINITHNTPPHTTHHTHPPLHLT